jgi:hypothetical protein
MRLLLWVVVVLIVRLALSLGRARRGLFITLEFVFELLEHVH